MYGVGSRRGPGTAALTLLAATALTLAGCGGGSGEPSARPSSGSPASPSPNTPVGAEGLLDAGSTAVEKVPGSTVISIETERDDAEWEVQVVTRDGTEHELAVSANGSEVLRGPSTKPEDAADRAKHRKRIAAATLDFRAAVGKIQAATPAGRFTELNLDTYRGATVWEADIYDHTRTKISVKLDAATGKIVANSADD